MSHSIIRRGVTTLCLAAGALNTPAIAVGKQIIKSNATMRAHFVAWNVAPIDQLHDMRTRHVQHVRRLLRRQRRRAPHHNRRITIR